MHRSAVRWLLAIGLGIASASPALAQFGVATLSHADGAVTRLHAGAPAAATINVSLIDGDQIETASGRAEISFLDGTTVHLDRDTGIVLGASDGFRLLKGRVSLRTSGYTEYLVDTAATKLRVQAGSAVEIRVKANGADAFLNVISGSTRIDTPIGPQRVPDYYTAYVSGPGAAPIVTKTASTSADDFGRWTLARTVMATSTALKGTEGGGGVAYAPWYYTASTYYQPYYGGYYETPYYAGSYYSSSYATPYYSYPRPYYSNLYYAAPYSYYNPYSYAHSYSYSLNYPSYRSPVQGWRGADFPRPSQPIAYPPPRTAPPASRGAIAVVPRR